MLQHGHDKLFKFYFTLNSIKQKEEKILNLMTLNFFYFEKICTFLFEKMNLQTAIVDKFLCPSCFEIFSF